MPRFPSFLRNPTLALTAFTFWALSVLPAHAQLGNKIRDNLTGAGGASELPDAELPIVIGSIINVALTLLGTIFLVLIIYAGFTWILARGREEEVQKAQKIIETSVIGLLIILIAYAISRFVFETLIRGTGA